MAHTNIWLPALPPVDPKRQVHRHPVLEAHAQCGHEDEVDLEGPDQEGPHGPLVAVEGVVPVRPGGDDGVEEEGDVAAERGLLLGGVVAHPVVVAVLGRAVAAQAEQHEAAEGGNGRGQDQARRPAEDAAGDRVPRLRELVLRRQLHRLVRAHEARQEGEDGHADAALEGDAEDGELQQAGAGSVARVFGVEEWIVPGASHMGEDDEEGGDASQALRREIYVRDGSSIAFFLVGRNGGDALRGAGERFVDASRHDVSSPRLG
jgi:hypothetical protein